MATKSRKKATAMAIVQMSRSIGFNNTTKVLAFLATWAAAMQEHDWEPITLADYESYAGVKRAAAFEHQRLYRQVFDDLNPNDRLLDTRARLLAEEQEAEPEAVALTILGAPSI